MNRFRLLPALLLLAFSPGAVRAEEPSPPMPVEAVRIDGRTVDLLEALPIQDGGRVKPFDTYARVLLLRLHGSRSLTLPGADASARPSRIGATEWVATCLIYPEWAVHYPTFRLDNTDLAVAIGIEPHASRRDRYTYAELFPGRQRLFELAEQYDRIERRLRSPHQEMLVALAGNLFEFESLLQEWGFTRSRIAVDPLTLPGIAESNTLMRVSEYLRVLPRVREVIKRAPAGSPMLNTAVEAMTEQLGTLQAAMSAADRLHLFPPPHATTEDWDSAGTLIQSVFTSGLTNAPGLELLATMERLVDSREDPVAMHAAVEALATATRAAAAARGEGRRLELELALYRSNFLFWSLFAFVFSFLCLAATWLRPDPTGTGGRLAVGSARAAAYGALTSATVLLVAVIAMRCVIRGRPPVSTLYETILFITAVAVLISVALEWISRQRIAIALAPALGALGLFLANKYELKEATDTMPSLQAVLDTNFWLATHVTCITIGYAAGLLAGAIGHLDVLGRVLRIRAKDPDWYAGIGRMVYGVLCFGLLFSFVGTMLGGIWANYSWGRFWGWDPKENGALMIVLWQLIVLHARMGGYVREFGVSMLAIVGACIVAFSWWGVNLLGVGLHSYGFTHGIWGALMLFWTIEAVVLALGAFAYAGRLRRP